MNLTTFWHVAIMGAWKEVVQEQGLMFRLCDLRPKIGIVGPDADYDFDSVGDTMFHRPRLKLYEMPTLHELWKHSKEHPNEAVLYTHTKAVFNTSRVRHAWRQLMQHWLVWQWRRTLPALDLVDIAGVDYVHRKGLPHFMGNFWMARTNWIRELPDPLDFARHYKPRRPRLKRFAAERWLFCKPGYSMASLSCVNVLLGSRKNAIRYLERDRCNRDEGYTAVDQDSPAEDSRARS